MSYESHLASLEKKHAEIERIIAQKTRRPNPHELKISELKRRKLWLKDKLSQRDDAAHAGH